MLFRSKYGFKNINRKEYKGINLSTLQYLADNMKIESVDRETLLKRGYIKNNQLFKILGNGELKTKLSVKADAFSKSAEEKIISAGGTVEKY